MLGPSGSGKSSLLRAGLLPAIAGGALPARGSWAWPRVLITPGRRPLRELAAQIASLAGIPAGALEADLRTDPARITGAIRQALLTNARRHVNRPDLTAGPAVVDLDAADEHTEEPETGSSAAERQASFGPRLVLIVDQFEEIFTQCTHKTADEERRTFIKALCAAAGAAAPDLAADCGPMREQVDERDAPALVMIGMRADLYARGAAYPELVPHLQDNQVLVGPIDEAGLREAIEKPAATAGLVAEAALVEVLLADLGLRARPHAMPDSAGEDSRASMATTDMDSYEAGKLALLSYALQRTWRNREGRRLTVAGYRATGGIDGAVAQAADSVYSRLDLAGQAALQRVLLRLVTIGEGIPNTRRRVATAELAGSEDGERATPTRMVLADLIDARLVTADGETVEITHETLLTAWPRLQQWLAEDRKALLIHRDLTDTARDWEQEGRDPSHLFRGTRLAVAQDWATDHGEDLNSDERAFLTASQHDQRRTIRLRRAAVATLAVLTVVSSIAAVVAGIQRFDAVSQSRTAQSEEMAAEATDLFSANAPLAMLLSLQAYERAPTLQARSALIEAAGQPLSDVLTDGSNAVASVAFSPNGQILAVGDTGGHAGLWNIATGRRTATLAEGSPVASVAFSPDGQILAAGDEGGHAGLWNIATGRRTATLGEGSPIISVAFSPDGRILAAGDYGGDIGLWDTGNGRRTATLGEGSPIISVRFSPDGRILAAGDLGGDIGLWDTARGRRTATLTEGSPVASVAFSPDGRTLAAGDYGGDIGLWDTGNGQRTATLAEGSPVYSVAFSPDTQILGAGDLGGHIGLWDTGNGQRTATLAEGRPVYSVAFSPNGQTLAAGDYGGDIGLWDTGNAQRTVPLAEGSPVYSVAFSPNGQTLAIGNLDGNVTLFRESLWNLSGSFLSRLICGEVRRNMTQAQWAANALGQPYQKTCSAYP